MNNFCRYLFLVVFCTGLFGQSSKRPSTGWAILQGPTNGTDTIFAVLHHKNESVKATVGNSPAACDTNPKQTIHKKNPTSEWELTHFVFQGLPTGGEHYLRVEAGKQSDVREFNLLPPKTEVKFAIASCMNDSFTDVQGAMWKSLLEKKPEVLFLIGDNTYADSGLIVDKAAKPDHLWKRFVETRQTLDVFRSKQLVPTYATWDDHDYGVNDGDSSYAYKIESKVNFLSFFPQQEISYVVTIGGQDFLFMDDRSFRTKETHWGKEQEVWMMMILHSTKNPAWIINGGQFFGGYHEFESYEGRHPKSFKQLLASLRTVKKPVNFISGDRHLTEVMKIDSKEFGREAYELTSSGIHAKTYPDDWDKKKNPRQVAGVAGVYNYMIVESGVKDKGLKAKITAYTSDKKLYEHSIALK